MTPMPLPSPDPNKNSTEDEQMDEEDLEADITLKTHLEQVTEAKAESFASWVESDDPVSIREHTTKPETNEGPKVV